MTKGNILVRTQIEIWWAELSDRERGEIAPHLHLVRRALAAAQKEIEDLHGNEN